MGAFWDDPLPRLGGLGYHAMGAEPGEARFVVVLCHGYAASAEDISVLAKAAVEDHPELAERVRFYCPAGVVNLDDPVRAWWPVEGTREPLARKDYAAVRQQVPLGMSGARRAFSRFLSAVLEETKLPVGRLILGGFSQGAQLAVDAALRLPSNPAGIVVLSSMAVCEAEWRQLAPARAGVPVVVTHGERDELIDVSEGAWLPARLEEAGLTVTFHTFDGSHNVDIGSGALIADWLAERVGA